MSEILIANHACFSCENHFVISIPSHTHTEPLVAGILGCEGRGKQALSVKASIFCLSTWSNGCPASSSFAVSSAVSSLQSFFFWFSAYKRQISLAPHFLNLHFASTLHWQLTWVKIL